MDEYSWDQRPLVRGVGGPGPLAEHEGINICDLCVLWHTSLGTCLESADLG